MIKVLVIDDDVSTLRLLNYYMPKHHRVHLELVRTGRDGIERARTTQYHIIFVDYLLVGEIGEQIANEIYRIQPTAMVVLVTSRNDYHSNLFRVVHKKNGYVKELGVIVENYRSDNTKDAVIPKRYERLHNRIQRITTETVELRQIMNSMELKAV